MATLKQVKKILVKSLMIKISRFQESPDKWEIINWFSYFKYDNGIITCRFDNRLKPYLLGIKNRFIISDLRMIFPITVPAYSKRIYLLLKEYAKIAYKRGSNI